MAAKELGSSLSSAPVPKFESSKELAEAINLITEMVPMVDPSVDWHTIADTEASLVHAATDRKKELEAAHSNLKSLNRTLETARSSSTRQPGEPTEADHAAAINALDATRLSLIKAIHEAESTQSAREAELAALREEARILEELDPAAEHERESSGNALRLQIYKGMGFEPVLDDSGKFMKMLVRSRSGDIHCVPRDKRQSPHERLELIWKLASS